MRRADSLEKTLMLGGIGDRRRRGWHRMRWFGGITDSMDMDLSKLGVDDGHGGLACCNSRGRRVRGDWVTELTELNVDNGDLLQKVPWTPCYNQWSQPCSRPLPTHTSAWESWTLTSKSGSVLVGLLLLSPGSCSAQGLVYALQESVSQSCGSSGSSVVGIMVTSSKRAYAIPRSTAPKASAPVAVHCWPIPPQEIVKQFCLSLCGVSGSWGAQGFFEPCEYLWRVWSLILNAILPLLLSWWGFWDFRKASTSALLTTSKTLTVWITTNCGKFLKRWEYQTTQPTSWEICMQVKKQWFELDMEQQTGSKLGQDLVKAVYCQPAYLTYMQSTSWEMLGWMKHKLESRFLGEILIISDMQMAPPLWQKVKN